MKNIVRYLLPIGVALLSVLRVGRAIELDRAQYHDYESMTSFLKTLARDNPKIMKLESKGKTLAGKEIWSVTISAADSDEHPAVLVVGGVEGADLAASEMCLQFIDRLVTSYGKIDSVTRLLEQSIFYIFPRVNPDAAEAFFDALAYERRLNAHSMDLDKDGVVDEDGYEDLNGDGVITMMRISDPIGDWLPDKDIPELMRKADRSKGEEGLYRLLPEGYDNDGDGKWNEDEAGGVDFNRNFGFNYRFFAKGSGVHQISEVESRAVTDFVFAHPNTAVIFSFSHNDNLTHPWKPKKDKKRGTPPSSSRERRRFERKPTTSVLPKDAAYFDHISENFKNITRLTDAPEPQQGEGAFSEWAYYHFCRWSLSVPSWWAPIIEDKADTTKNNKDQPPKSRKKLDSKGKQGEKDPLAEQRRLWKWLKATGQQDAFVGWTAVSHRDFPDKKVEVGGLKPFVSINPPADSLENRGKRYGDFLLYLGSLLPRVNIEEVNVEHLHRNIYRIEAYVTNEGYLPTNTELGIRSKWNPKVRVSIKLAPKQKLVSGKTLNLFDVIPGSGGSKKMRWLVSGKKGTKVSISAGSPMAGTDEKVVVLK